MISRSQLTTFATIKKFFIIPISRKKTVFLSTDAKQY